MIVTSDKSETTTAEKVTGSAFPIRHYKLKGGFHFERRDNRESGEFPGETAGSRFALNEGKQMLLFLPASLDACSAGRS